jgi:hypothetical protein
MARGRLAFLADLARDVRSSVRARRAPGAPRRREPYADRTSTQPESRDGGEMGRRLDATRERLRTETPPDADR